MRKLILAILLFPLVAFAGPPIVFGPNSSAMLLTPNLLFKSAGPSILTGSADPSSVATSANPASLYMSTSGNVYIKGDSGSSVNWTLIGASGSKTSSTIFDDFTCGGNPPTCTSMTRAVSGTGATSVIITGAGIFGATQLQTGTDTTGWASLVGGSTSFFGNGAASWEARIRAPSLSDGTNTYYLRAGITDANSAGTGVTNGAFVEYSSARTFTCSGTTTNTSTAVSGLGSCVGALDDSSIQATQTITGTGIQAATTVSSIDSVGHTLVLSQAATASGTVTLTFTVGNFWICGVSNANSKNIQVTNIAVAANTWTKIGGTVAGDSTSASCLINGVVLKTFSTNIPVAANPVYAGTFLITKTAGTTSRNLDIDYWYHTISLTTPR